MYIQVHTEFPWLLHLHNVIFWKNHVQMTAHGQPIMLKSCLQIFKIPYPLGSSTLWIRSCPSTETRSCPTLSSMCRHILILYVCETTWRRKTSVSLVWASTRRDQRCLEHDISSRKEKNSLCSSLRDSTSTRGVCFVHVLSFAYFIYTTIQKFGFSYLYIFIKRNLYLCQARMH